MTGNLEPEETEEAEEAVGKREAQKTLQDLKIITAISLGKDRNKELAKVLDTDKSFAAKKIKNLEERGLIQKSGEGKATRYSLINFNVFKFLQSKVVITVKKSSDSNKSRTGSVFELKNRISSKALGRQFFNKKEEVKDAEAGKE